MAAAPAAATVVIAPTPAVAVAGLDPEQTLAASRISASFRGRAVRQKSVRRSKSSWTPEEKNDSLLAMYGGGAAGGDAAGGGSAGGDAAGGANDDDLLSA